tara:strand:+ start:209 stop:514 length:306 start_codon:yes stop_codon:yes gene_type:complete
MTVQDMIDLLNTIDDKNRPVAFSTRWWWDDGDFHSVNLDITNIEDEYLATCQGVHVKLRSDEDVAFNTTGYTAHRRSTATNRYKKEKDSGWVQEKEKESKR